MRETGFLALCLSIGVAGCAVSEGLGPEAAAVGGAAGLPGVAGVGAGNSAGGVNGGGGSGSGGSPSAGGGGPSAGGATGAGGECSDALKQIYVLTALETPFLYRFDANNFSFTEVGPVACPFSPPVYSFTISKDGTAWLSATSGQLFQVSLETLACTQLDYDPKPSGWYQMQLAFAADGPGSKTESLFAVDAPSGSLGTIDPLTLEITKIGKLSPSINLPRLTGTGDGKLFTMGFTTPIAEVNKTNGGVKVLKEVQELAGTGGGLGFAQLEGDLFAFRGVGPKTVRAGRFSTTSNSFVQLKDIAVSQQALIAGAAVSTCAPFEPPK